MNMVDFGVSRDRWLCPSDRELALRAKLNTGWSVKTSTLNSYVKPQQISDVEIETVIKVLKRAECIEQLEKERIGRLVERLENMKKNAMGNGVSQCVLCADRFGFLGASPLPCNDCCKAVCATCGVDTVNAQSEPLWLCKICAETREMWKKSGAWFLRKIPEYVLPKKNVEKSKYGLRNIPSENSRMSPHTQRAIHTWSQRKEGTEKESTDSSDDDIKMTSIQQVNTMLPKSNNSDDESDSETSTVRTVIASRSFQTVMPIDIASTSEENYPGYPIEQWDITSENSRVMVSIDSYDDHDIRTPSVCESFESELPSRPTSRMSSSMYITNAGEEEHTSVRSYSRQESQQSMISNASSGSTGVESYYSLSTSLDKLSVNDMPASNGKVIRNESNKRTSGKIMQRLKQSVLKPHK